MAAMSASQPAFAQASVCTGTEILCDDFNGTTINAAKWIKRNGTVGPGRVRPGNLALSTIADNDGQLITVVDVKIFGDLHSAAPRQGGILETIVRYGGGRYEVRMKNLPDRYGCSCFWTFYDSEDAANPPRVRKYTEIDIEMPANMHSTAPAWTQHRKIVGLNTWLGSPANDDAVYQNVTVARNPFDAKFHIYRFDWKTTGRVRTITWFLDGMQIGAVNQKVGTEPAKLFVGAWPAPWPGMHYDFDVQHLYIDWVRISALP